MKVKDFDKVVKSGASLEAIVSLIPQVTCGVKSFYTSYPSLFKFFDPNRCDPEQWATAVAKYPKVAETCDFSRFENKHWVLLLRNNPRYLLYATDVIGTFTDKEWLSVLRTSPILLSIPMVEEAVRNVGIDPTTYNIPDYDFVLIMPSERNVVQYQRGHKDTLVYIAPNVFNRDRTSTVVTTKISKKVRSFIKPE